MKDPTYAYFGCLTILILVLTIVTMFTWLQEHLGQVSLVVVFVLGTGLLLRLTRRKIPNTSSQHGTKVPNTAPRPINLQAGARVAREERAARLMDSLSQSLQGKERRRK